MANSVLITGGSGFLGSHLCEAHLKQGDRVLSVDSLSTGSASHGAALKKLGGENFHSVQADVCQPWESWAAQVPAAFCEGLKTIYHFASPASPPHYQSLALETLWVNSLGLKHAIDFADAQAARVVFASTSEIYGDPLVSPQPETYWGNVNTVGPRSCYDESKRFGEALIYTHNWKRKTRHGMVRIFNTYGPGMNPGDGRVVINFLVQAQTGQELTIYGDGQQSRSFCYVDDLVQGILAYAQSTQTDPINLGNPTPFTMLELIESIQELCPAQKLKTRFEPLPADDPKQRCPDISRARERLGWEPQISLRVGLERMWDWLQRTKISTK